ncbi:MAG: hypothetical protein AB2693_35360, partial [Candidatus Thiodiazotropha sp.]
MHFTFGLSDQNLGTEFHEGPKIFQLLHPSRIENKAGSCTANTSRLRRCQKLTGIFANATSSLATKIGIN